jgi:hypothetical protein
MSTKEFFMSHPFDINLDQNLHSLIQKYGVEGYGRYWLLMEFLGREFEGKPTNPKANNLLSKIAKEFRCDIQEARQFLNDCVEQFNLLEYDGECIYSPWLTNSILCTLEENNTSSDADPEEMLPEIPAEQCHGFPL